MKVTWAIIGGGIAGLTTAIALKRIGIEATVFEATPEFKPVGAGLVLAANAMRAYQHIDIYDPITAAGHTVEQFTIYDNKGKVISRTFTNGLKNGLANFAIHRAGLHHVLLSHLNSGQVIPGKRSSDIITANEGYTIRFDDDSEVHAQYVIVAEGIHSVVRKKVLPQSTIRYAGYTCWRGITDNITIQLDETFETWGPDGRFGSVPLAGNKVY